MPAAALRFPARAARLLLAAAVAAAGCSPTFNWREARVGDDGLIAMLPCKPDRATRELPLGSDKVAVQMAGCEAGGATFAIAYARAASPAQAEAWMQAWRAATRAQLAAGAQAEAVKAAPSMARAAASPAPARLDVRGTAGTGADSGAAAQVPALHVLWFAQQSANGTALYQATVLGTPSSAEAASTFFEGLRLP